MMKLNKALYVLRWVGFLPAAMLATYVVEILLRSALWSARMPIDTFRGSLFLVTVGSAALGATFVYVGAKVAPAHRVKVALILGGIVIVICGATLVYSVMFKLWWAACGLIFYAVGAGTIVWYVHAGQTDLE